MSSCSSTSKLASGAGSTSISNGPALNGRPHSSSPLYVTVIFPPHKSYSFTMLASNDPEISQAPDKPFLYVASATSNPAASEHAIFDGNSGVEIVASGAGSTSISNGPALNGRPHSSSPLYVTVIFPPQESYSFTILASNDPEISQASNPPFVYVASATSNPAASEHAIFDGNSGVETTASGAGKTLMSTLALSGFSHSSWPFQVIVIVPPHESKLFV